MIRSTTGFCLLVLACAGLGACSSHQGTAPAPGASYQFRPAPAEGVSRAIVDTATSRIGSPYRYGAGGPNAFDCSGLVVYSYRAAGLQVPRTSAQQFAAATPVGIETARPGDLLFFRFTRKVSHVGIYLGGQQFVHAPSSGGHVSVESLQHEYYREHFVGAGRLY